MNLTIRAIIILIFLTSTYAFSQKDIISLKSILTKNLSDFEFSTKANEELNHINILYFKKIVNSIDSNLLPIAYQKDTTADLYLQINYNVADSSLSYHYTNWGGGHSENFFKDCYPKDGKLNYDPNVISTCSAAHDVKSIDTLFNIIITKPTNRRYEVYRSMCPGGASKIQATKHFMQHILGQYQLIIYCNKYRTVGYFIAPPRPSDKFRIKHTTGHF